LRKTSIGYRWFAMNRSREPGLDALGDHEDILPWTFWQLDAGGQRQVDGGVVMEEPLEIRLDGRAVAVLMRTPGMEKELAAGFLLSEGWLASLKEIVLVRHCGGPATSGIAEEPEERPNEDVLTGSRNVVETTSTAPNAPSRRSALGDVVQLIRSGCGRAGGGVLAENLPHLDALVQVDRKVLPHMVSQLTRRQDAYRTAGGIHAAAVFDASGEALVVAEDIGRHNAMDKALGYCLLRGIPLGDKLVVTTGRASYDMVAKGARMRVSILASLSSPTSLAVELAEAVGCTLLGYLRGRSIRIYANPWRITGAGME
jgi:FdhD protein